MRRDPKQILFEMIVGAWLSQAIYVAAKLGIADALTGRPLSASVLAKRTGTQERTLSRVMICLASQGVFKQKPDGRFQNSKLSSLLCADHPKSLRAMAVAQGESNLQSLLAALRTGKTVPEMESGVGFFEYLGGNAKVSDRFDEGMASSTERSSTTIVNSYNFSKISSVADIAGGRGGLMSALLRLNPHLRGIVVDRPQTSKAALKYIKSQKLSDRCQIVGGDFFRKVPKGIDCYILKHILHMWPDDKANLILKNIRSAMPKKGRVLIIESILPPPNSPSARRILDLDMLVTVGGKERTQAEYRELLRAVGIKQTRCLPINADLTLIEGMPS